jgi:hypothetical protein
MSSALKDNNSDNETILIRKMEYRYEDIQLKHWKSIYNPVTHWHILGNI